MPNPDNVLSFTHRPAVLRSDNIRSVRPIEPDQLEKIFRIPSARETGEAVTTPAASPVNIWDTFEERERRARVAADELRDARHRRLQAIIHWSCIVVALATIIFFAFQLGRGAL